MTQTKAMKPTLSWLSDPRIFAVNKIAAHSDHRFYQSVEEAVQGSEMALKQSLNGRWHFAFAPNPGQRPQDFYREDYDCSDWKHIEVPGHIQLQGWDRCQYINTLYPWDGQEELRPPQVPEEDNPAGSYIREFELKPELQGRPVYLSFQGVETAFYVWVNGQFVGYNEDSFTPAEFEITHLLHSGVNRVAVEVYKRSSASWIQDQDFWRFSGIFREVYLYTIPEAHIQDLALTTELNETYTAAVLHTRLQLQLPRSGDVRANFRLLNAAGQTVASQKNVTCEEDVALDIAVSEPHLWSAEDPYLYRLLIELLDQDGKTLEAVVERVGFRDFALRDGVMLLNGRRIVFKGVDRHEFDCRRGRAITHEDMLWDIRFLKRHNINGVRTSHYPNQSEWYRLCDEYGIYLIDETNLESHGSWQKGGKEDPSWVVPGDRDEWHDAVLDRARSMLERDKNHPSVLIWSCGNESFGGRDLYQMAQYFRKTDPTRLVHYEGIFHDRRYPETSDMESRMYAKPHDIEEYLQSRPQKPYISCEYMHAMGNSCGGMHLYTELEEKYPQYQGGFIWDYIDQAILVADANGKERMTYGGDFDDRATDYHFCTDGIVYAQRAPSPKVQEVKFLYQNVKLLPDQHGVLIKNQNLFVSTDGYYLRYALLRNGEEFFAATQDCDVPAGEERYFTLQLPELLQAGEYTLQCSLHLKQTTLWAEQGYEQASGMHVWTVKEVKGIKEVKERAPRPVQEVPLRIVHGDGNIGVHYGDAAALFSLQEGGIISLRRHDEEFITRAPKPFYWRATTDNDRGSGQPFRCAPWYAATLGQRLSDVQVTEKDGSVTVTYAYQLPLSKPVTVTVAYTIRPDGAILVHAAYPGAPNLPELPVFGLSFRVKAKYQRFRWYGLGPDENYIDRAHGARLGIFETSARENLSQYIVPQECGNRTGVRWAEVSSEHGTGLRFEAVDEPFECSAVPYTALELENALHREELPAPDFTVVNVMARQMGVGGDDSWGAPVHPEFLIPSDQPLALSFLLTAFD